MKKGYNCPMSSLVLRTPTEIFKNGISPSMVGLWQQCRRKWYNHYVRGWEEEDRKFALFGSLIDEFLNDWHGVPGEQGPMPLEAYIERFKKQWPLEYDFDKRTQAMGVKLIELYPQRYPLETEPFEVLEIQKEYIIPMLGMPVPLHIKIDFLVKYRSQKWVLDNKTTGRGGVHYFDNYLLDFQQTAYVKGVSQVLGEEVGGMFYNVLVANKNLFKSKKDALENFMRDDFTGTKVQAQRDYEWKQFVKVANQMYEYVTQHWQDVEEFPFTTKACFDFFTPCAFLGVCQNGDNTNFFKQKETPR